MANEHNDQIRIVQETVAGKEITFAHVMGGPAPIIYQKLGLNPQVDYRSSAIGMMIITGEISDVMSAMTEVVDYFRDTLGYVVCNITKR